MKLPPIKINFKTIFKYLFLVLTTAFFFSIFVAALPQTERWLQTSGLDLKLADQQVWQKSYTAQVTFEATQVGDKWSLINEAKNTLYNRMSSLGVEHVFVEYTDQGETKGIITVTVKSTKNPTDVEGLLRQRGNLTIMVKKPEVTFDDSGDQQQQLARYLPDSYNESGLTRKDFRTVYITKLKTTAGDEAYFGIFKPWIWNNGKFNKFLKENSGADGGVNVDGFVTPISIPVYDASVSSNTPRPIMTVGLSSDTNAAFIQEIMFNSGSIPMEYSYQGPVDLPIEAKTINYFQVFAAVILSVLLASLITFYAFRYNLLTHFMTVLIYFCIYLVILKLAAVSILSTSLILTLTFATILSILLLTNENRFQTLSPLLLVSLILYYPLKGVSGMWAGNLLITTLTLPLLMWTVEKYFQLLRTTLRK